MLKLPRILVSVVVRALPFALAAGAVVVGGCGQKGPLYLPTDAAAARRATLPETLTPGSVSATPVPATPAGTPTR
ncbi:MAG: lipoprotein [Ramlibacter sp.]|nr:lipoprotein [Ramlibacter sp.]